MELPLLAGDTRNGAGGGTPIGLILWPTRAIERVELLQLDGSGIRVASYLTDLPPMQLLR